MAERDGGGGTVKTDLERTDACVCAHMRGIVSITAGFNVIAKQQQL